MKKEEGEKRMGWGMRDGWGRGGEGHEVGSARVPQQTNLSACFTFTPAILVSLKGFKHFSFANPPHFSFAASSPPRGLTLFRCANGSRDPGTGLALLDDLGLAGSLTQFAPTWLAELSFAIPSWLDDKAPPVLDNGSCTTFMQHIASWCKKHENGDGRVTAKFDDLSPVTCSEGDGDDDDDDDDDGDYDFAPAA
ncbi:hypothetical protein ACFX15_017139 [Malus domestica]